MAKHSLSPVDDETHAAIIKLAGRLQEREGRAVSIPRAIHIAVTIANQQLDRDEEAEGVTSDLVAELAGRGV